MAAGANLFIVELDTNLNMLAQILLTICLILLVIGLFFSRRLMRNNAATYGLFFGAFYFLFFPLLNLLWNGVLSPPISLVNSQYIGSVILKNQASSMMILLGYLAGLFIIFLFTGFGKRKVHSRKTTVDVLKEIRIYFAMISCYFLVSIFIYLASGIGEGGHWYRTRQDYLADAGVAAVVQLFLIWGLRILIVSFTFELLSRKSISTLTALVVVVVVSGYELFFVGNRIVVLMFGVTGMIYIYNRYGGRKLFVVLLLIIPIALGLAVYQDVRYLIFSAPPSEILLMVLERVQDIENGFLEKILLVFEYMDSIILLNLINDVGKVLDPINGATFLKIFTWLVPRSIWPDKPMSVTVLVGEYYLPGRGVSLVPLIFGEYQYNFGHLAPVLFPFCTYLIVRFVNSMGRQLSYAGYFNFLVGFLLFRLPISDTIVSVVFAVLMYKAFVLVFGLRLRTEYRFLRTFPARQRRRFS